MLKNRFHLGESLDGGGEPNVLTILNNQFMWKREIKLGENTQRGNLLNKIGELLV